MDSIGILNDMKKDAHFSADRKYRYALWRIWDKSLSKAMFIGLNPSVANETEDDPTIKRCIEFSKSWGHGGVIMGNLFAYCATDPQQMMKANNPIGEENDRWLVELAREATIVVGAWGNRGVFKKRGCAVRILLPDLYYLKLNKSGEPSHPLYLLSGLKPKTLIAETI